MHDTCIDQMTKAIDETVSVILRQAAVKRPPIDAVQIARRVGYHLLWDENQTGRARISVIRPGPGRRPQRAICLKPDPRPERIQWAVAHEIGEQYAGDVVRLSKIDLAELSTDGREQIANALATRLLLPSKFFSRDAVAFGFDLCRLKGEYSTASHEIIARRMLDLPAPMLITIFDNGRQQFRRWNCPGRPPPLSESEVELRQAAHESGKAVRRFHHPQAAVWPVHEPGWKREVIWLALSGDGDGSAFA
jgi:hypothetical protein